MLTNLNIFENSPVAERLFKGGYACGLNTAGHTLSRAIGQLGNYDYNRSYFHIGDLNSYGVIDTPEQFRDKFAAILEADPREFAVFFTHIAKEPENKGQGGGWRWHKWGSYYGDGEPQCEYLDDEDGFDNGVYVFHIYIVNDVNEKCLCYFDVDIDGYPMRIPATTLEAAQEERVSMQERAKELKFKATCGEIVVCKELTSEKPKRTVLEEDENGNTTWRFEDTD